MKIIARLTLLAAFLFLPLLAQAQAPEFPKAAGPCVTCHGKDGLGTSPGFPNLCGQKSIYMMEQLTQYREKKRVNEIMNITAANLTDDEIRVIAEYYEAQPACK